MCIGGGGSAAVPPTVTPAPAPAAPEPAPNPTTIGTARQNETEADFGNTQAPNFRINRGATDTSATSGGVGQGGSGLKM